MNLEKEIYFLIFNCYCFRDISQTYRLNLEKHQVPFAGNSEYFLSFKPREYQASKDEPSD